MLSAVINKSDIAVLVVLLNFANQQLTPSRLMRACALATPGANKEAVIVLVVF